MQVNGRARLGNLLGSMQLNLALLNSLKKDCYILPPVQYVHPESVHNDID